MAMVSAMAAMAALGPLERGFGEGEQPQRSQR